MKIFKYHDVAELQPSNYPVSGDYTLNPVIQYKNW